MYEIDDTGDQLGLETNIVQSLDDYLEFLHSKNRNLRFFATRRIQY